MDKVDVRGGPEIGTVDVSAREDRHLLNADTAAGLLVLVDLLTTSEICLLLSTLVTRAGVEAGF